MRLQDVVGASFAIVGGFLIIQFSQQSDDIMNAQQILQHLGGWQFIIYVIVQVLSFVIEVGKCFAINLLETLSSTR